MVQNCQQVMDCFLRLPTEISEEELPDPSLTGTSTGGEHDCSRRCDGSIFVGNFGKLLVGHSYILIESLPNLKPNSRNR